MALGSQVLLAGSEWWFLAPAIGALFIVWVALIVRGIIDHRRRWER